MICVTLFFTIVDIHKCLVWGACKSLSKRETVYLKLLKKRWIQIVIQALPNLIEINLYHFQTHLTILLANKILRPRQFQRKVLGQDGDPIKCREKELSNASNSQAITHTNTPEDIPFAVEGNNTTGTASEYIALEG